MRCFICDVVLSEKEVKFNSDHKDHDPCTTCLNIINEVFEPLDEDEISRILEEEDASGVLDTTLLESG